MSDSLSSDAWPPWGHAGLFFALAFGGIQGVSAILQGTITLPALVSAIIAALTGAGIVYSYERRRQAGVFDRTPPEAEPSNEPDHQAEHDAPPTAEPNNADHNENA
ncbi:MAG: hypothetical protein R6U20_01785 [Longimonas sp.]|uniref:hypothetical protein n=1 Tax=Longimonas sp. TaxID=2039626 RepID=UPI00397666F1